MSKVPSQFESDRSGYRHRPSIRRIERRRGGVTALPAVLAFAALAGCGGKPETQMVDCWLLEPTQLAAAAEDGQCLDAFARYVEETEPAAGSSLGEPGTGNGGGAVAAD